MEKKKVVKKKPNPNMSRPNNQFAKKLITPELKKEAYSQYCAWIAQGHSKESWTFSHPDMSLTHRTMEKYIRESDRDFPPIQKQKAEAESLKVWENRGLTMMLGQVEKCQPAIFQMFMRNKFGWDKANEPTPSTAEPLLRELIDHWKK